MDNFTIEHNGLTYANFTRAALLAAGVPAAAIDAAATSERRELVKAECRRRIYGVGSSEAQINVTAMSAAISAKPVADRTPQELALLASAQSSIEWVMTMRARFAELADGELDADYLRDDAWPACPPDVVTLYQQF
jgi:hypothetical protein